VPTAQGSESSFDFAYGGPAVDGGYILRMAEMLQISDAMLRFVVVLLPR
jgi:hypothetical protein